MKKSKVKVYLGFGDPLRCDVSYCGLSTAVEPQSGLSCLVDHSKLY